MIKVQSVPSSFAWGWIKNSFSFSKNNFIHILAYVFVPLFCSMFFSFIPVFGALVLVALQIGVLLNLNAMDIKEEKHFSFYLEVFKNKKLLSNLLPYIIALLTTDLIMSIGSLLDYSFLVTYIACVNLFIYVLCCFTVPQAVLHQIDFSTSIKNNIEACKKNWKAFSVFTLILTTPIIINIIFSYSLLFTGAIDQFVVPHSKIKWVLTSLLFLPTMLYLIPVILVLVPVQYLMYTSIFIDSKQKPMAPIEEKSKPNII